MSPIVLVGAALLFWLTLSTLFALTVGRYLRVADPEPRYHERRPLPYARIRWMEQVIG